MNLKVGDLVRIDDKEAYVTGNWGAGKHMMWKLSDGREVQDLHLAVANGSVSVVAPKTQTYGDLRNTKISHLKFPSQDEDLDS